MGTVEKLSMYGETVQMGFSVMKALCPTIRLPKYY